MYFNIFADDCRDHSDVKDLCFTQYDQWDIYGFFFQFKSEMLYEWNFFFIK